MSNNLPRESTSFSTDMSDETKGSPSSPRSFEKFLDEEDERHGLQGPREAEAGLVKLEQFSIDEEAQSTKPPAAEKPTKLLVWIIVNILATIGIVFINKSIFDDPAFRGAQLSFASFHFFITFLTLHVVSMPRFGMFVRQSTRIRDVLPLAAAMSLNVVLPNLSLAYSSVTFYQTARILLTPVVASLNYFFYKSTIPYQAALTLVPVCVGVGMVTYYDTAPAKDGVESKGTSFLGAVFAFSGVLASSIYTVWIFAYHKKLNMTSQQLLHNQAPVGAVLLLYFVPFLDTFPVFSEVPFYRWVMILTSGVCACLINLSQFAIIGGAGPVSSTVVGHTKTCSIVILGWIMSGRSVADNSIIGVIVAIGGIMLYSVATILFKGRK